MHAFSHLVLATAMVTRMTLATDPPPPFQPEPIEIIELPLPPVIPEDSPGACSLNVNPRGTGCIGRNLSSFQVGDFNPTGNELVANIPFIGSVSGPRYRQFVGQHILR